MENAPDLPAASSQHLAPRGPRIRRDAAEYPVSRVFAGITPQRLGTHYYGRIVTALHAEARKWAGDDYRLLTVYDWESGEPAGLALHVPDELTALRVALIARPVLQRRRA